MDSIVKYFSPIFNKLFRTNLKVSFSQTGEDLIVKFIFDSLRIKDIRYLDIGTNHPSNLNNTYLFYSLGFSGVCVEPDPDLYKQIKRSRPKDISLNVGIASEGVSEADFFVMDNSVFNTFSEQEALRLESSKEAFIKSKLKLPLKSLNTIIDENFKEYPNFISLDVEGLDFEILKGFDFKKYRPKVLCIETISFSTNMNGKKSKEIIELMSENDYRIFADTYINTIFVANSLFE